jgi:hypothetical protein
VYPMPCGHCGADGCRYCALYKTYDEYRAAWEPPLQAGVATVLKTPSGLVQTEPRAPARADKPRVQVAELAAKRQKCREQKARGLPCTEFESGGAAGVGASVRAARAQVESGTEGRGLRPVSVDGSGEGEGGMGRPRWAYGLTTVPQRRATLLPRTLASLREGGFPEPVLFVDGANHKLAEDYEREFSLPAVGRFPTIKTFGNWALGLAELTIRNPLCDRFAMFQDDFVTSKGLRDYLDACPFPDGKEGRGLGYLNLYTFDFNWARAPRTGEGGRTGDRAKGWFTTSGRGLGAVALVFNREGAWDLLTSKENIVTRPAEAGVRAYSAIDGGIVDAMKRKGYREYCHNPSLVQHIGISSTMGNNRHPSANSFLGETADLRELIKELSGAAR